MSLMGASAGRRRAGAALPFVQPGTATPALESLAEAHRACRALAAASSQEQGLHEVAQALLSIYDSELVVIDWFDPDQPLRAVAPARAELASWWAPWQNSSTDEERPVTVLTAAPGDRQGALKDVSTLVVIELGAAGSRGAIGLGYAHEQPFTEDQLTAWGILGEHLALALRQRSSECAARSERNISGRRGTSEELIAIAAHELRTPLTPITMLLQSLERKAKGGAVDLDAIARTRRQVNRLTKMISDLLDLSRLRRDRLGLSVAPVDLGAALVDAARVFREADQKHHIELLPVAEPLRALFDRERLHQCLLAWFEHIARVIPAGQPIRVTGERRGLFASLAISGECPAAVDLASTPSHDGARAASLALAVHLSDALTAHLGGSLVIDGACGERVTVRLPLHDAGPL